MADVEAWLKGFIKTNFCLARANCSSGFPGERLHGHPYRLDSAKRATKFYGQCLFDTYTILERGCVPSRKVIPINGRRYRLQPTGKSLKFSKTKP